MQKNDQEKVIIREPTLQDKESFLKAMIASQSLHHPWVKSPTTAKEFDDYLLRSQQPNQKCLFVCDKNHITGVFNISEIVKGLFQSAYLGFYAVADYAGQGYMSAGLKQVLRYVFEDMKLHRLEANIQPENTQSIQLIKNNGFHCEGYSPHYLKINNEWRGHERWAITAEDYFMDNLSVLNKDHETSVHYSELPKIRQEEIKQIEPALTDQIIIDLIVKKEKQLLDKVDPPEILAKLIDNEFLEIGSSATIYDKTEVVRWLKSNDQSIRVGTAFKAHLLSEGVILLTYISTIKDKPNTESKQAMRSSIWRLAEDQWRMVFHQGTPIK